MIKFSVAFTTTPL